MNALTLGGFPSVNAKVLRSLERPCTPSDDWRTPTWEFCEDRIVPTDRCDSSPSTELPPPRACHGGLITFERILGGIARLVWACSFKAVSGGNELIDFRLESAELNGRELHAGLVTDEMTDAAIEAAADMVDEIAGGTR